MIKIDKKNLVIIVLVLVVFISLLFKSFMYDEETTIEDNLNEILVINNVEMLGIDNSNIINNLEEKENIKIHITGEVVNEGIVILKEGDRIEDAINKAGGTTQNADLSKVKGCITQRKRRRLNRHLFR